MLMQNIQIILDNTG